MIREAKDRKTAEVSYSAIVTYLTAYEGFSQTWGRYLLFALKHCLLNTRTTLSIFSATLQILFYERLPLIVQIILWRQNRSLRFMVSTQLYYIYFFHFTVCYYCAVLSILRLFSAFNRLRQTDLVCICHYTLALTHIPMVLSWSLELQVFYFAVRNNCRPISADKRLIRIYKIVILVRRFCLLSQQLEISVAETKTHSLPCGPQNYS